MCSRSSRYVRQLVRSSVLAPLVVYAALTLSATAQTLTPPSIAADWTDYSAGEIAYLTGDYWRAGEIVRLQISEDGNPGHVETLYAIADEYGSLAAQYVVPGHGTAQNFTVAASRDSGVQASTVFSNAGNPAPFSWSTSDWTTAAPSGSPWIRTDRDDYQPGSMTLVAGGGWTAGDLVTLAFTQTTVGGFQATVWLHAVADDAGAIYAAFVLGARDLGESYEVVAASFADGTTARTTFTDGGTNFHTCALVTNGGAKCWGFNDVGTVGDGTTIERHSPVNVSGLASGVVEITTGTFHTCAVTIAGGVKCWGDNGSGQVGDGTNAPRTAPVDVVGLTSGVAFIGAGEAHTCAVTTGGAVKCWGENGNGQLGNGASGFSQVRTGGFHSCALSTGGGVMCWGGGGFGQLGNSSFTAKQTTPVAVSGLSSDVIQIAAGADHTCAVTTGGGVKCWGLNGSGQLGNSNTINSSTPVDVTGLTSGVAQVAIGGFHTCALTSGGNVKCWGDNHALQLGDGTTTQRTAPVDVLSGATQIYAASEHTCALTSGGGITCWGTNTFGQLGDGTITNHATPANSGLASGVIALPEVKAKTYTLTYHAGGNGALTGVATQIVYEGQSGTAVAAVANSGYHFSSWSDGNSSDTRTDSGISNLEVTASFLPDPHTVTYTAGANGSIKGTSPQIVPHGTDGSPVQAVPNTGYHFVQWSDGYPTAARTDLNVTADVNATASFAINQYTLAYSAGANGSVTGTLTQVVNYGDAGTAVTASPNVGYLFSQWSDGSTTNPRIDVNVAANVTVSATFVLSPYTVEGFFAPIDMPQASTIVWNNGPAGQTVPVKWRLLQNGAPVSDPTSFLTEPGGLYSYQVSCTDGAGNVDLALEEFGPGNSTLSYKGDGYWQYNWKTEKSYKGTCRIMFVKFKDGTIGPAANFKFK
jgi:hypothetical protein